MADTTQTPATTDAAQTPATTDAAQTPATTGNAQNTTASPNMRLGVKFTLLRTPLFAGVKTAVNDGYEILLTPTDRVAGPGMTIEDMVKEINQLMGKKGGSNAEKALDAQQVQDQLTALKSGSGDVDFENIRISLNQAFLHYKSTDGSLEYAISITVDAKKLLPDMNLINFECLTLSVWNTTRPTVLTRMGLTSGADLLGE